MKDGVIVKKIYLFVLLYLACWSVTVRASTTNELVRGSVCIRTQEKITKGFPCILKVSATGPLEVPKLSLFEEVADITVRLMSITNGSEYIISSSCGMDMVAYGPLGERRDDIARKMCYISVDETMTNSMLFDIYSLRPELGSGIILDAVPAGKYTMSIECSSDSIRSNSVIVELLEPTEEERHILDDIRERGTLLSRGMGVNWSKALRENTDLSIDTKKLRKDTLFQLQFHLFLSSIVTDKMTLPLGDKEIPVPEYLKSEKEFLFLELESLRDGNEGSSLSIEKSRKFRLSYPDVGWRLESPSNGFLIYKSK